MNKVYWTNLRTFAIFILYLNFRIGVSVCTSTFCVQITVLHVRVVCKWRAQRILKQYNTNCLLRTFNLECWILVFPKSSRSQMLKDLETNWPEPNNSSSAWHSSWEVTLFPKHIRYSIGAWHQANKIILGWNEDHSRSSETATVSAETAHTSRRWWKWESDALKQHIKSVNIHYLFHSTLLTAFITNSKSSSSGINALCRASEILTCICRNIVRSRKQQLVSLKTVFFVTVLPYWCKANVYCT